MHSSRMRTARLLTIGELGGVPVWGCTCPGVYLPMVGLYLPGGVHAWRMYLPGYTPPPLDRILDTHF